MPIYGYRCEQCGHEVEVLQSMSEAPLKVCPQCMGPLHKMVYPAGIIFKGSGYYTTDYKAAGSASRHGDSDAAASDSSAAKSGASETAAKSGSGGESKGEPKGESKSESKSEPKPSGGASKASSKAKPASE